LHNAFETGLAEKADDDDLFSLKLYSQTELKGLSRYILKLKANKSSRFAPTGHSAELSRSPRKLQPKRTEPKLLWQVKKSLAWRYHFGDAPLLPAKLSVTQLTHRGDEYAAFDYSGVLDRQPSAVLSAEPDLARAAEGRLIGTATHLVIAQLDLARPITKEAIEEIEEKLLADGAITKAVARHINAESIITFFESKLGRAALDANSIVWREWPFTFAVPAFLVARAPSLVARVTGHESRVTDDEAVIVQGIIDMLVRTPQGLAVIDFKTDSVSAEQAKERAVVYREQLEHYGRAAGAILKSKILGQWLYFLTPGCAIEVT
jgi:ATP-dependent helicase/nuclease subunit A